jgi:4-amino-4-deoxy-L-arabinose transferase-like glycosyltransferase
MGAGKNATALVNRIAAFFERLPASRPFFLGLVAFLLLIFAGGNLPWHLDNYDQAKQAYVAFEISRTGNLWYQHTPQGRSASKPPLMGWLSAGMRAVGVPWDFAWRLPSFFAALALLAILVREGQILLGAAGATLGAAAFGLNLLTPRLATLVRTDMLLGAFIFLIGWMIYRKLRAGTAWTSTERWLVFAFMTAALFTKGPVIYAFLLPGMVAFAFLERDRAIRRLVWSGWWTWAIPLALFLAWGVTALLTNPDFHEDVVQREFFSRFQEGSRDDERPQPLWFYFPHLLHKFAPWSLLLIGLVIALPVVRRELKSRPAMKWLVLWAMGGLVLMTLVPAKRVDRIFPVVPPLCLLVVEVAAASWSNRRVRIATGAATFAGLLMAGGYFVGLVPLSIHERTPALVEFSGKVRALAGQHGLAEITLPRARDEGLLLYFDRVGFSDKGDAFASWKAGKPMALVLSDRSAKSFFEEMGPVKPALDSGPLLRKNEQRYSLFLQN